MTVTESTSVIETYELEMSASDLDRLLGSLVSSRDADQNALADVIDITSARSSRRARGPFAMPAAS